MARAEAAHASARSDSIKGLAQSIAKPAYKRLLTAEPALRRAVPALIIAFLITIAVGAFVQILDHRRSALARGYRQFVQKIIAELPPTDQEGRLRHAARASLVERLLGKQPVRQWRARPLGEPEVLEFRRNLRATGIRPVVAHDCYLVNLAAPALAMWRRSLAAFEDELVRAETGYAGGTMLLCLGLWLLSSVSQ